MMKKQLSIATSVVLIFMLFATLATTIPVVRAYDEGYGYASNLYTTNWRQYGDNGDVTADALNEIAGLFANPMVYEWYDWWGVLWVILTAKMKTGDHRQAIILCWARSITI